MTDDRLFLVTGATGKTGRPTIDLLLRRGHRVRAIVHREDERSRRLDEAGAEVVAADLLDLDAVSAAMEGVSGAYLCYPISPTAIEATTIFAQAAIDAGVRSLVNMSELSCRRDARSGATRQHWLCERMLDRTGLLVTHLRPALFSEWMTQYWELRGGEGYMRLPLGEGRHAPIAMSDQARVIAEVLADPEPHDHAIYTLHGPVEMNYHEIARAMADELGMPVHYEPISIDEFAAAMTELGMPPYIIQHLSHVALDCQNGVLAGTNDNVERIGGRAPLTVQEIVAANRKAFDVNGPRVVAPH
ncbi:NmrA family NAD(P)-binding protein [Herbidospora sp. RD11066]